LIDRDLILAKATTVDKHVNRVKDKVGMGKETFLHDMDLQEIVMFNLQTAIQNCIDIAAHIISEEGFGVPGSTSEMFYKLQENGFLNAELTEKMVNAVGFRNLLVHEYTKIDMEQVYETAQKDITDLTEYLKAIFKKTTTIRETDG
jgi:uncharacterized protein YutE (UPF0331/DUF86 family)